MLAHGHAGGFLNTPPYYLEATPGFEIRVYSSDLPTALGILESLEIEEALETRDASRRDLADAAEPVPMLPIDWDPGEASREIWAGENEGLAEYISSSLAENGVPCRIPDEPGHRFRLCVRSSDVTRAKDILREIAGK